jgi:hypothetical protein
LVAAYNYHISASYGSALDLQRSIKVSHSGVIDERPSKGHIGLNIYEMNPLVTCFEKRHNIPVQHRPLETFYALQGFFYVGGGLGVWLFKLPKEPRFKVTKNQRFQPITKLRLT